MKNKLDNLIKKVDAIQSYPVKDFLDGEGVQSVIKDCPNIGAYIFFINDTPLYIGVSKDLHRRIKEYVKRNTRINDNPLILNIAKEFALKDNNENLIYKPIKELDGDKTFSKYFIEAKNNFISFNIKVIEIKEEKNRMLFESYYSLKKNTKYNGINYSSLGIYNLLPV